MDALRWNRFSEVGSVGVELFSYHQPLLDLLLYVLFLFPFFPFADALCLPAVCLLVESNIGKKESSPIYGCKVRTKEKEEE